MNTTIPQRLAKLRDDMRAKHVDVCIIPSADTHQSEYVSDHFKYRACLSGFTGSAGTLVVALDKAGLWTDSRYFLQAEAQLEGSGIDLFKMRMPGVPALEDWIVGQHFQTLAFDGNVFSAQAVSDMKERFEAKGVRLKSDYETYKTVWPDRPPLPSNPIYPFPEKYAGKPYAEKLSELRELLSEAGADTLPLCSLDEIAWLFNLRGSDVAYNPVGLCYALVEKAKVTLFVEEAKLPAVTKAYLAENGVETAAYDALPAALDYLDRTASVFVDKNRINASVYEHIPLECSRVEGLSPITTMKALKNETEKAGIDRAVRKDGVMLVRFWRWMENALSEGIAFDEMSVAERLASMRLEQEACVGESFEPIVGYGSNGAVVHYSATPESKRSIMPDDYLLIDTGGQYYDGTTDLTRSFSLYRGETPEEYKKAYAAVLKGHIALAECVFPAGTRGAQIDALARQFLWKDGWQYGHGTGHGIGHFLNVHEGPQSIRMEENATSLKPGMLISNEPGVYLTGKFGIRLENMVFVYEKMETEAGKFYAFETLTLCPFDLHAIDPKYYTEEEIRWINAYHQKTYDALAPALTPEERQWLKEKTKAI